MSRPAIPYDPDQANAEAVVKLFKGLKGARIIGAEISYGMPYVTVQTKDGVHHYLFIQRDPEGNGPGFVHHHDDGLVIARKEVRS